jgi:hypothetical protein
MARMKYLFLPLFLFASGLACAETPAVTHCFKVNALIKMDEDHYWADWTNSCPYTIDSVYVMVKFSDKSRQKVGDGVWSLHFVGPGLRRVMRLSAPKNVPDFQFVNVKKVTLDFEEALR